MLSTAIATSKTILDCEVSCSGEVGMKWLWTALSR